MKHLVALILLFVSCYFAGMNQQKPIMAVIICAVAVTFISLVFSLVMKFLTSAKIPAQKSILYKNNDSPLTLSVVNNTRIPVNRVSLTITMQYASDKKNRVKKRLDAAAAAKSETEATMYFNAPYCGLINANITKIRVYDYFSLFHSSGRIKNEPAQLFILPVFKDIQMIMPPFGAYTANAVDDSTSDRSGDDHSEIHLIREYRQGDLTRHIHRNYSAKTQKLWIKEYCRQNDFIFDLVADSSASPLTTDTADAMYEILFSLTNTLFIYDVIVRLHWYDRKTGTLRMKELGNNNDLMEVIPEIYKTDIRCTPEEFGSAAGDLITKGMLVNSKLEWFFLGEPVYSFNKNNVENELITNIFDLRR